MDWYILKVQSNREESIPKRLQRQVKIAGLDQYFDEVIVPTEKVTEFKGGKKKVVERKLYPGYIVVHMDINDDTWFAGARDVGHRRLHRRRRQADADARRTRWPGSCRPKTEETDEAPKLDIKFNVRRPGEGQGRHVRELRRRSRHDRRGERPRDGDDQHLRPQHAGRIGILADRSDVSGSRQLSVVSCQRSLTTDN